ncbi:hypothetical protein E1B28_000122 [Marasmius oreades]|uniref:Uncharacterized protein n=1 Tax=Marasmius oreades TaxID=181124 RepID=A0A9P7V0T1_9AGAR|nr:uncharacterized protein E1B28_000122 [Marasmius oreades]KAG7098152.1 hypothetical protein E1B28_000122 [Marasmius oreades]
MLRRFINSIYPSQKRYKICFVGLGYTGKTTLLYQLKLGLVGATIPTIGFNVEEVDIPGTSLSTVCWDLGLGCADIRVMIRMLKSVVDTCDAAVWLVDCKTVKDELDESLKAFQDLFTSNPDSPLASMPTLLRYQYVLIMLTIICPQFGNEG